VIATLQQRAQAGDTAAQIAMSAEEDRAGRYQAAIDWLARAARGNDPVALRLLGLRLVTGFNAPPMPHEGADFLRSAAGLRDANAAALLALFAGIGYLEEQSWPAAITRLRRAAEFGLTVAQEHLDLIGAEVGLEDDGSPASAWLDTPAGVPVESEPRILRVPGLLSHRLCDALIARSAERLVRAEVNDPVTGRAIMGKTRTNRLATYGLLDTDLVNLLIQARLAAVAGVPTRHLEAFSILNYRPGEQASEHFDFIDPTIPSYPTEIAHRGQRTMTLLVYLNDGYEGGTTDFPTLGIRHRGAKGDGLLFFNTGADGEPDRRMLHAGRPPTSGEKWVLSQFIRARPQL
jgi:prolyl 4-hydroxylase